MKLQFIALVALGATAVALPVSEIFYLIEKCEDIKCERKKTGEYCEEMNQTRTVSNSLKYCCVTTRLIQDGSHIDRFQTKNEELKQKCTPFWHRLDDILNSTYVWGAVKVLGLYLLHRKTNDCYKAIKRLEKHMIDLHSFLMEDIKKTTQFVFGLGPVENN